MITTSRSAKLYG